MPFAKAKKRSSHSQKVRQSISRRSSLAALRYFFKSNEFSLSIFIKFQHDCQISHSIAIIRGTPNCHQILVFKPIDVAILHKLVSSANKI